MKIAVYTIAKDEEKFAERWAKSCEDADYRIVADTGSKDSTIDILTKNGVIVHKIDVTPWRFDISRNKAMSFIPMDVDVCVSLDMDEILKPGWRQSIERMWKIGSTTFAHCRFASFWPDGSVSRHYHERIHARRLYHWANAVHERLVYHGTGGKETIVVCDDLQMEQHPDRKKDRSSYVPLMELAVREDGTQWKLWYFLAEEYEKAGRNLDCVHACCKCMSFGAETWPHCRQEVCRMMARCAKKY